MHVDRAARLALHEHRQVVHPRVVRAQIAPADEHERAALVRGRPVERGLQASDVGHADLGRELDHPGRRAQHLGDARLQRTEVDAVRIRLELRERQTVGIGAEAVAVRTGAQHEVEDALRTAARRERLHQLVGVAAFDVRSRLRATALLHETGHDEVVERVDVDVRALARRSRPRAATSSATPAPRPARARRAAASSSPRCGSRGCRARGRSDRGRARARAAGSRSRGASSR